MIFKNLPPFKPNQMPKVPKPGNSLNNLKKKKFYLQTLINKLYET